MSDPIVVSQAAVDKIAALIKNEQNPDLHLRVFIEGGGCSGFQYGFHLEDTQNEDDITIAKHASTGETVLILIDPMSLQYLNGAEMDYSSGLEEQIVIRNPNTKTTCGCGSSFSIDDAE